MEQNILERLRKYAERWGFKIYQRNLEIPEKWIPVVVELDEALAKLDPDYEVVQVKVKFNGLRYYTSNVAVLDDETKQQFFDLIGEAEHTCYELGA